MHSPRRVLALLSSLAVLFACPPPEKDPADAGPSFFYPEDDHWTIFHIQMKGTHNSYHVQGDVDLIHWNYTHAPLDEQAQRQGVRAIELDLQYVPAEDRIEVFHVITLDDISTCRHFRDCLAALRAFSDANRGHHPLFVQMEGKGYVNEDTIDAFIVRAETDIREVWGTDRLITPAMVQRDGGSVHDGLARHGWPTLKETRGKAMFVWDDTGLLRSTYTRGGQNLDGRIIFVDSAPGEPFAAVAVLNDPVAQASQIADALRSKMLVRTRADSDSVEPSHGDRTRLEAALASGANVITTDYPAPDGGWDYWVEIPGGTPSRCNPVTTVDAGRPCHSELLE